MLIFLFAFIVVGALIGFMAGLLGIGGGTVIVPVMHYMAEQMNVPTALIMKMSLGTSFAIIIMSTASSAWSHNKRGTILWEHIPYLGIGSALGVILGSLIVNLLSNTFLQIIFCIFLAYTIYSMVKPKKKQSTTITTPNFPQYIFILLGLLIGFLASFIGIAGGAIAVPLLVYIGYEMHKAIATSAMIGVILSTFGAISYIYNGWGAEGLPAYSLGYVYLPAFICIALMSILTAPLGVKLSYKLPVPRIRQIFALFLLVILIRMLSSFIL
ncbi:sulfite exporter TauE/SafE family protein [Wohlfahrtiimonas larvae]|uniref:Probable membrane transporter protein n=1 Tax=Wohlfahrtiimonas larvae TaxID=1157986 RepID=A0ABP9MWY4_9GAMM|nr:sulfite exporter TauE/SafE family protein [Wohlfahrtiimonas larvae]